MADVFPDGAAAAVSLSFDDGRPSHLSGIQVLDDHEIRATFYVLPAALGQAAQQWRAIAAAGHEIGNHSSTHPCSGNFAFSRDNALEDMALVDIAADIDRASRDIEAVVGVRPTTFAYPCGQAFVGRGTGRTSYVPVIAERFLAGRGYLSETANDPRRCDLARLEATVIDGMDGAALEGLVARAVDDGAWLIVAGHDIGDPGPQTVVATELARLCRRLADDDRVWVAPVAEVAGRLSRWRAAAGS